MAVSKKISTQDLNNAIDKSVNRTPGTIQAQETAVINKPAGTKNEEKDEKIKVTFFVNKSTKDLLDEYTKNNDMTLTAGIKKAIREMLQRENVM